MAIAVSKPTPKMIHIRSSTTTSTVPCSRWGEDEDLDSGAQVGIYGWRKRCLYLLILGLLVVVIVNLSLTLWLLRVLDISTEGMGQLRIVAGGVQLRGQALVLDALLASSIRSRRGLPLSVESARNFTVTARDARGQVASRLVLGESRLAVAAPALHVTDARGATLLAADARRVELGARALRLSGEGGARVYGALQTPLVRADAGHELRLESPTRALEIRAPLGVALESRAGPISASCLSDLRLQSVAGAVRLDAAAVFLQGLRIGLPPAPGPAPGPTPAAAPEVFQLCACANGRLFLAPPRGLCAADEATGICRTSPAISSLPA